MPLWTLIPIDPDDPNWEASSHKGRVVVRARDESAAREVAEEAFAVKTRFPPGRGVIVPPWTRPALVRVEAYKGTRYEADGPSEVLEPSL